MSNLSRTSSVTGTSTTASIAVSATASKRSRLQRHAVTKGLTCNTGNTGNKVKAFVRAHHIPGAQMRFTHDYVPKKYTGRVSLVSHVRGTETEIDRRSKKLKKTNKLKVNKLGTC